MKHLGLEMPEGGGLIPNFLLSPCTPGPSWGWLFIPALRSRELRCDSIPGRGSSRREPGMRKRGRKKPRIFGDKTDSSRRILQSQICPKIPWNGCPGVFFGKRRSSGISPGQRISPPKQGTSKSPECRALELLNQLITPATDISINCFNSCFHRSCLAGNQTAFPW